MENIEFKFKTNINCSGCVAAVKPYLDNTAGVCEWQVDTSNKDKMLTVKSEGISETEVMAIVQEAGFQAELLSQ